MPNHPDTPMTAAARRWLPHALLAAVVFAFFTPLWAGGVRTPYSDASDILDQHLGFRLDMVRAVRDGRFPTYSPTTFCGLPLVGDPQSGLFYPPNWLHLLAGEAGTGRWFGPLIALHLLVGGAGMIEWLRRLEVGVTGQLAGALAFAFAGKWLFHVLVPGHVVFLPLAWTSWQCLLVHRVTTAPSVRGAALLALATGVLLTGLHPQLAFYSQLLVAGYALGRLAVASRKGAVASALAAAGLLALTISAVHWLPILSLLDQAVRGDGIDYAFAADRSLEPAQLWDSLLRPLAFGTDEWERSVHLGVVALALAVFGIGRRPRLETTAAAAALVLILWFASGEHGGLHRLLFEHVWGFHLFRIPTRAVLAAGLPLGLLAGCGADRLMGWTGRYRLVVGVLLALLVGDSFRGSYGLQRYRPLDEVVPVASYRRVAEGRTLALDPTGKPEVSPVPPSLAARADAEIVRGFNPLLPEALAWYLRRVVAGKPYTPTPSTRIGRFRIRNAAALTALGVGELHTTERDDGRWNHPVEVATDVVVYHAGRRTAGIRTLPKVYRCRLDTIGTPAWLAPAVDVAADRETFARQADGAAFRGGRGALAFVERPLPIEAAAAGDRATVTERVPGQLEADVRTAGRRLLVMSERFGPGWRATIDGRAAEVLRVDHVVCGVVVPPGRHVVRLRYVPPGLFAGALVTAGSLVLMALAVLVARRRSKGA